MPYQNNLFILRELYKLLSEHFLSIQHEKRITHYYSVKLGFVTVDEWSNGIILTLLIVSYRPEKKICVGEISF